MDVGPGASPASTTRSGPCLGGLIEYKPLNLRPWTHTFGYRGHILTKSRRYSTTYGALREE
ncbi:replication initiator [Streptomyces hyaluromycini]|uniref:replication initiator n=1 Tax=Streptomyces hyaluromycini TaxID=1377993 RepID=UPI000B5CBE97